MTITTLHGDCREQLQTIAAGSVQCIVTSPPYYGLRKYSDDPREIGQEAQPDCLAWARRQAPCGACYVCALREVFAQVWRVLRDDGVIFLNLGDSYAAQGGSKQAGKYDGIGHVNAEYADGVCDEKARTPPPGFKPKDLLGIPWRVAFALQADGYYLRNDNIWAKPNCMPESVTDRCTRSHEYVFLLAKSARYFYDSAAIAEETSPNTHGGGTKDRERNRGGRTDGFTKPPGGWVPSEHQTRNRRTVWSIPDPADERAAFGLYLANLAQRLIAAGVDGATIGAAMREAEADNLAAYGEKTTVWKISTQSYSGAHYATMPEALIAPCILAGSSAQACETCGAAWGRVVERTDEIDTSAKGSTFDGGKTGVNGQGRVRPGERYVKRAAGFAPRCTCAVNTGSARSVVLDPFAGSGTVQRVAARYQRDAIGIELNADYIADHIETRTDGVQVELFV